MAEFLTTHATASSIENIILNAKEKLILVSPYLQLSKTFFERLKEADERGVKIVIVYGKDKLNPGEKAQLGKLRNLSLFFGENVHAKCYLNEVNMVITSMNMYEFSEKNNREMGVLVTTQNDANVYKDALREVQSMVRASLQENNEALQHSQERTPTVIEENKHEYISPKAKSNKPSVLGILSTIFAGEKLDAYCIRCGDSLPFDDYHPLCDDCFDEWNGFKNPTYVERYCHSCGKSAKTTKVKPLCTSCYSRIRR